MLEILVVCAGLILLKKIVKSYAKKRKWEEEYRRILSRQNSNGDIRNDPNILFPFESDEVIKARKVFGLYGDFTKEQVMEIFRGAVKECHPDKKGDVEAYLKLVSCKDILLSL
jgi:hypothetical protein